MRVPVRPDKKALRNKYSGLNVSSFVHALCNETFLKDNDHLFSEPNEVKELSIYHHSDKLSGPKKLIQDADSLSSHERKKMSEEYEENYNKAVKLPYGYTTTPLFSVFAQVELDEKRQFSNDRYDLSPLDIHNYSAFPKKHLEKLEQAYHQFRMQMEEDILVLGTWKLPDLNFQDDIVTIYHILYKYLYYESLRFAGPELQLSLKTYDTIR